MLTEIKFSNFKCYKNLTTITIKKLSLFSGINNSGKSTIAQLILLLSQSIHKFSENRDYSHPTLSLNSKDFVLGTPDDILNDKSKPLHVEFYFDNCCEIIFDFQLGVRRDDETNLQKLILSHFYCYNPKENAKLDSYYGDSGWAIKASNILLIDDIDYAHCFEKYMRKKTKTKEYGNLNVEFYNVCNLEFSMFIPKTFEIPFNDLPLTLDLTYRDFYNEEEFERSLKKSEIEFEDNVKLSISQQTIRPCFLELNKIVKATISQAFRGTPERLYTNNTQENPLTSIYKYKTKEIPYKYNFDKQSIETKSVIDALKYWFIDEFKICEDVKLHNIFNDYATAISLKQNGRNIYINNVGFGTSQLLPLVVSCLLKQDGIIVIDEPESHLHPSLQTKIGEFLLHMSLIGKQIIVETHSEHIINILNYYTIKYSNIKDSAISYWIEKKKNETVIDKVKYDEYGFIINQPDGFYDETAKIFKLLSDIREKMILGE